MISFSDKQRNLSLFMKLSWRMFHVNNTSGYYHRYVNNKSREIIQKSYLLNDGSIPERIYKKITWYMAEALVLGEILAHLAGESVDSGNKESLIYLGAIMALYDVMIDDFNLEPEIIRNILEDTFSSSGRTLTGSEPAIVFVYFLYLERLKTVIDPEQWLDISRYMSKIKHQLKSVEQKRDDVEEAKIIEITIGKGGVAALIFSAILRNKNSQFKDAVFEMGGFIQMMNDCQDIYRDTVSGIRTFVHFRKDFEDIIQVLNEERIKTFRLIRSLNLHARDRYDTLFDLNAMFIVIAYKIHCYAEICNYSLDFSAISKMNKKTFRINPFSPVAIYSCTGKILRFDPDDYEYLPEFRFVAG